MMLMRANSRTILLGAGILSLGIAVLAFASDASRGRGAHTMFTDAATPAIANPDADSQGACWADFNGDGKPDLFVAKTSQGKGGGVHLWRNDSNGSFVDVAKEAGLAVPTFKRAIGCAFIDIDNDGYPDLYVTSQSNKGSGAGPLESRLFKNNGDGTFTDVTDTAGVGMRGIGSASSDWADYDGDGDYDAFVAARFGQGLNSFFEQTGPLTFRDLAREKSLADPVGYRTTFLGSWFDYNNDGRPDLLVAVDWWGIELFRNDGGGGGTLTRATPSAFPPATDSTPGAPPNNPMGVTWGDYNNDGCIDLYVSSSNIPGQGGFEATAFSADSPSRLYRNNCNGTFTDVTRDVGLLPTGLIEWSAQFVDFDNDGDLDLAVVAGNAAETLPPNLRRERGRARRAISFVVSELRRLVPPRVAAWAYRYEAMIPASGATGRAAAMPLILYKNMLNETGKASFVNVTDEVGVTNVSASRGSAWADFDNDGALDWFVAGRKTPSRLFHNNGPVGNYLRVHLVGNPLRDAVGAWVKIKTGSSLQIRHVHVLDGYLSQSQMDPHFGLGKAQRVDEVWVRWPNMTSWVKACSAVPANHRVTILQTGGCRLE